MLYLKTFTLSLSFTFTDSQSRQGTTRICYIKHLASIEHDRLSTETVTVLVVVFLNETRYGSNGSNTYHLEKTIKSI
jgi:hypothetical protein